MKMLEEVTNDIRVISNEIFKYANVNTALMLDANRGRAVTVKAMLKLGVNPFKKNKAGQTAADVARQSKYLELANLIEGKEETAPAGKSRGK